MRESWHEDFGEAKAEAALVINNVSKVWETTGEVAVNGLSMKACVGEVTVLLGHNGAGKSTTYNMICGFTSSITIFGKDVERNFHSNMGFCPQWNSIFECFTVDDHLWFFFKLKGGEANWKENANELCSSLGMQHLQEKNASELSGGEKRKLCLALAFIGGSRLLILDEPTAEMDPHSRKIVTDFIIKQKKER
ncbi:ABC transporter, ATP-binding protein [Cooperia oncophora]